MILLKISKQSILNLIISMFYWFYLKTLHIYSFCPLPTPTSHKKSKQRNLKNKVQSAFPGHMWPSWPWPAGLFLQLHLCPQDLWLWLHQRCCPISRDLKLSCPCLLQYPLSSSLLAIHCCPSKPTFNIPPLHSLLQGPPPHNTHPPLLLECLLISTSIIISVTLPLRYWFIYVCLLVPAGSFFFF